MGFLMYSGSAIVCACIAVVVMKRRRRRRGELPPSPAWAWPILGHLLILRLPLHQCLFKLAQMYGPFFHIKLGTKVALVVSSPHWAKEFLHVHDRAFADRPQLEASKRLTYNRKSALMMNYGPAWRHLRKLYTMHILTPKHIEMSAYVRHEEVTTLINLIRSRASLTNVAEAVVDIRALVFGTMTNIFTRMLFSRRAFHSLEAFETKECKLKEIVEEIIVLLAIPLFGDVIPWLAWLDIGTKKRMDVVAKEMDDFLEDVVASRIKSNQNVEDKESLDYLDLLLNLYKLEDGKFDKESIKSILQDLLIAGTDTTTTTVEWTLAELFNNPSYLKKLQQELDTKVGEVTMLDITNKWHKGEDLAKLGYMQAIIKESLRFHPPIAILPRELCDSFDKGIQVGVYQLPKKTRLLVNIWALGRDTTLWGPTADTFCPNRFLNNSTLMDIRNGQHFEYLPFGTGRRGCPGMNMALTLIPFMVAHIVQPFNWTIPNGVPFDLSEASAFTTTMAKPLMAQPSLRGCKYTHVIEEPSCSTFPSQI